MKYFKTLAAMLLFTICMSMTLTSCSKEDNPDRTPGAGQMTQKLVGTWYSIYEASGHAMRESADGKSVAYTSVIDVYHFELNGSGDFQRIFFNDDDLSPALVQGILGYGLFNYRYLSDGKVSLALANMWGQSYPQTWDVTLLNNTITTRGIDGQMLTLEKADDDMKGMLSLMAEQNGSNVNYAVNDYKPTGVDNSHWMQTLADSRLVADLSLPGSHDACTADGWQSKLFGVMAESTAKTQDLSIREQLKIGMRVFDLRPERVFEDTRYVLRCSHGFMFTKLLVKDFFQQLKDFLAANPSEFCILTVDLSATADKEAWGREFNELISGSEFGSMFAGFKPRLTVGEMRGKVLILSKHEYASKPVGGYCYGWVYDKELDKQTKGHITDADGVETPLWVQDYWGKWSRDGKDEALIHMLEAAAGRDMTAAKPAWVINYPSAYFGLPLSDSYRENAVEANKKAAEWLSNHSGSVGIIYMDFAGMDKSPSYSAQKLYDTAGMSLVDRVIKQNFK